MTSNIFSKEGEFFLQNELCVCIDYLTNKILKDAQHETKFFKEMLDHYLTIEFPSNSNSNISVSDERKNKRSIELKLNSFY